MAVFAALTSTLRRAGVEAAELWVVGAQVSGPQDRVAGRAVQHEERRHMVVLLDGLRLLR